MRIVSCILFIFLIMALMFAIPASASPPILAQPKVTICHRPPDNPVNAKLITVAQTAVAEHLAHGDPIGDASLDIFFVDAAAQFPGNGQSASPFRRMTEALNLARCIRQAEGNFVSAPEPLEIRVAPGEYLGTFVADKLVQDQTLEELPIMLNVPNLVIQGSTTLVLDDDERPTGEVIGPENETIIAGVDPLVTTDELLFLITDTTDGMMGNQTTIEGFTLKSGNAANASDGLGITMLRVDDFTIRQNIFEEGFYVALDSRSASGQIRTNHLKDTLDGMYVQGPGRVDIRANRVLARRNGIYLATTVQHFPFNLGAQGAKFSIEPFEIPSIAHLSGSVTNNDLSGHNRNDLNFGLRLTLYGFGTASHITEQSLNYIVSHNTIQNNTLGVVVDAGYTARNDLPPIGEFSGTFSDNDVSGNSKTSMLVSFTRRSAALDQTRVSVHPYLQDSTYNITFTNGDEVVFADRWIDHPIEDPHDGRILNNVYLENGEPVHNCRNIPIDPGDPCFD